MGLSWFRLQSKFVTCVIQCPQSGIQREPINVDNDVYAEVADVDAEYEALVASSLVVA